MGRTPPNTVGSKSPIARSSIFRSPVVVWILVPRSKHLHENTDEQRAARDGSTFIKTAAAAADPRIALILIMLRRVRFSVALKILCSSMPQPSPKSTKVVSEDPDRPPLRVCR